MSPTTVLLVAAAAIAFVGPAAANLEPTGPYTITMDYIGKCDDGEYPDQINNITQVWNVKRQRKAFKGCVNRLYDDLCDECQMDFFMYRWDSTRGWSKFYEVSYLKPFDFVRENFPAVYEGLWRSLGYIKKPVTAGVYCLNSNMERPFTLKRFVKLPYGNYKMYSKGSIGGKRPTCFQLNVIIAEVGVRQDLGTTSPLPDLGSTSPLPDLGSTSPLPGLGTTSPLPDLGGTSAVPDLGSTSPLPDLGTSSPLLGALMR